ncbi:GATOR complex protein NPRL3 [Holothuria leucospilota]|uniref:GATOR complex protein NPRL3 n=1 Tax=Holothuria leucospilota TaxID=206669 RepID=A0A9Q1H9H3_HOLLE|nr:GATOR complex protein NPRL3 [Holothuria leucospilota]
MANKCTPLGIVLVSSGSKGDLLLFRYPYEVEKRYESTTDGKLKKNRFAVPSQETNVGNQTKYGANGRVFARFTDQILANILTPKTQLSKLPFELTIDDVKFVGFPTLVQDVNQRWREEVSSSMAVKPTMIMFNVVFVLNADSHPSLVQCYQDLSKRLAVAMKHEERRCGYLSRQAVVVHTTMDEVAAMPEDAEESPFKLLMERSKLCQGLAGVFEGLTKTGTCHVVINNWIEVSFCLPHKVHNVSHMSKIEKNGMEESVSAIKPYHALLLLEPLADLWNALPMDCSPALRRIIKLTSPLKNLQGLALDADLHLSQVFQLVGHLVYWGKATVIFPLCESNMYILSPRVPTGIHSPLHEEFSQLFPEESLTVILSEFSLPSPLKEHRLSPWKNYQRSDQPTSLVKIVVWLLQKRLLTQLHTYVFIAPPPDSVGDSEAAAELETKLDSNPDLSKLYGDESPADKQTDHGSSSGGQGENLSYDSDDLSFSMSFEMYSSSNVEDDPQKMLMRGNVVHMLMERLTQDERRAVLSVPAAHNPDDLKLFARLCPYFRGKHHLEEIMYWANVERESLYELLDKFRSILITCTHQDAATITYKEFL